MMPPWQGVMWLVVLQALAASSECPSCTGACSRDNIDLTFVLDGSGSVCESDTAVASGCQLWLSILQFISQVVGFLNIGPNADHVALVQFGNIGRKEFGLADNLDLASLQAAILGIQHMEGNTNTSGGLYVMRKEVFGKTGDRPDKANIAIVITDGMSTYDSGRTVPEATACANESIRIYVIGGTNRINQNEVRRMSAAPQIINVTYFLEPSFDALSAREFVPTAHATFCKTYQYDKNLNICTGTYSHTGCYIVIKDTLTRTKAQQICAKKATQAGRPGLGQLVSVPSRARNDEVDWLVHALWTEEPNTQSLTEFWLGGHRDVPDLNARGSSVMRWTWSDGTGDVPVASQGCFVHGVSYPDFEANYWTDFGLSLTPDNCTAHCSARTDGQFTVSGLQGPVCMCGYRYGSLGGSNLCTVECAGTHGSQPTVYCGGIGVVSVYVIGGVYGDWAFSQPNNHEDENRACGLLQWDFGEWRMANRGCHEKKRYICETTEYSPCFDGLLQNGDAIRLLGNKCVRISLDESASGRLTWFGARVRCSRHGQLLAVLTRAEHDQLRAVLNEVGALTDVWVGLVGHRWVWPSGAQFLYHNFDPFAQISELSDGERNCLTLRQNPTTNSFFWATQRCNHHLPSICRIDLTTPLTTSAAVTAGGEAVPAAGSLPETGAASSYGGLSSLQLGLIVAAALLLLIGLIVIIIACCYYKKSPRSSAMIHPEKALLAANMLIPYNQYYDKQEYGHVYDTPPSSGVVLSPAYLSQTPRGGGEDHAYMSYTGGSTGGGGGETGTGSQYGQWAKVYGDTVSGRDPRIQQSHQVSMTSQTSGARLVSRDAANMTVSLDGTRITMKN